MSEQDINTVETAFKNSEKLVQEHVLDRVAAELSKIQPELKYRIWVAYSLRGLTGVAALVVAFVPAVKKEWAIVIPFIAEVDKITGNHKRVISLNYAKKGYENLQADAMEFHQNEQQVILKTGPDQLAALTELNMHVVKLIQDGYVKIKAALDNSDLEILQGLAISEKDRNKGQVQKNFQRKPGNKSRSTKAGDGASAGA